MFRFRGPIGDAWRHVGALTTLGLYSATDGRYRSQCQDDPAQRRRDAAQRFRQAHPNYDHDYRQAHPDQVDINNIRRVTQTKSDLTIVVG